MIRAADLFCGAGGTTAGAFRAWSGRPVDMVAVNHWDLAVESHRRNHPKARHVCADVASLRPRDVVPGGVLDVLLASPECTHHSRARAGRPMEDQRRSGPWHVLDWLTALQVSELVVENVPDFADWGPLDGRGRPISSRKGETFRAWCSAVESLGYRVESRVLTCADYGDPTTRPRLFVRASLSGRVRWPQPSHGPGRSRPWHTAREILDLDSVGPRVSDRRRPMRFLTVSELARAQSLDELSQAGWIPVALGGFLLSFGDFEVRERFVKEIASGFTSQKFAAQSEARA